MEEKKIFDSGALQIFLRHEVIPNEKYLKKHLTFKVKDSEVTISGEEIWQFADALDNYGIHP